MKGLQSKLTDYIDTDSQTKTANDNIEIHYGLGCSEFVDELVKYASPKNYIAVGNARPTAANPQQLSPHYFAPIRIANRRDDMFSIFPLREVQSTYYIAHQVFGEPFLFGKSPEIFLDTVRQGKPPVYFGVKNQFVKEICSITIDLDVGRENDQPFISSEQALAQVFAMILGKRLPCPSCFALSGRGVYLIWLLRGEEQLAPPAYRGENIKPWKRIVATLIKRLEHLRADPNATRPCNWFKAPGTIDARTGKNVVYASFLLPNGGGAGEVPRYRLSELIEFLEIKTALSDTIGSCNAQCGTMPTRSLPVPPRFTLNHSIRARAVRSKMKGYEPLLCLIDEIERLNELRAGRSEGCRYFMLLLFYNALHIYLARLHRDNPASRDVVRQTARKRTEELNQRFRLPLPKNELNKACALIRSRMRLHRWNRQTKTRMLKVTPEEASKLELKILCPTELREKQKKEEREAITRRRDHRQKNRLLVDRLILNGWKNKDIIREYAEKEGFDYTFLRHQRERLKRLNMISGKKNQCELELLQA